ncbi:MAG: signal recognition particle-docking protein FtsY [Lachnospiraceae bacterium]|jgi:fused signal recognition particle receptor|nr:signal recognition particle-docking protein FtsY [Lachnospiraceae bacterium]
MGFFDKLKKGLAKTRFNVTNSVNQVFSSYDVVDDDFYEELEEIMIMSDMGVRTTDEIISNLKERVINENIQNTVEVKKVLMDTIKDQMRVNEADFAFEDQKSLILMIGVNGVGKTTTVGKLANLYRRQGKSVLIAAADTFRAGAAEQLTEWAKRAKVPIITGKDGGDPGAVVYDAIQAAKARDTDILIVDTAGRLHNKNNLMKEMSKLFKIIAREYGFAHLETLIVLDGTTGQNALMQAREFAEVTAITGIVLTKLDGTAKGGIAIAIQSELGFPVKYIGVGEKIDDMQRFDSDAFVDALFADDGNNSDD